MNPLDISSALRQLADAVSSTAAAGTVDHTPDGDVAVNPTGVNGAGKVRYWPKTVVYTNEQGGKSGDINLFSYCTRMMRTINPVTSQPFYPPGRFGPSLLGAEEAHLMDGFAACADRDCFPGDWATQAEIDQGARIEAAQGAPVWVSVPIAGQP